MTTPNDHDPIGRRSERSARRKQHDPAQRISPGGKVNPAAIRPAVPATDAVGDDRAGAASADDHAGFSSKHRPTTPRSITDQIAAIDDEDRASVASPSAAASPNSDPDSPPFASSEEDDAPNRVVFVLQRDLNKRLDKYLVDRIPFMSRTQLQRLIEADDEDAKREHREAAGGVTVNGRRPKPSTILRKGDVVQVFVPPPPPTEIQPENIPLDVLYEDDALIVLNKPPDIIVHPARSHNKGTLINALAFHFQNRTSGALSGVGKDLARPGVVHRLDRHTSGVIVFAKQDEAHWKLGRQFERRVVDKRYLAVVHGHVAPDADVIDMPIGPHPSRDRGLREKFVVRHDELGKPSVTICRVRWRFGGPDSAEAFSLVELELKTGRTHQIRVHLSHLGHPIVGDDMYGGRPVCRQDLPSLRDHFRVQPVDSSSGDAVRPIIARQALHAALLGFTHPRTLEPMTFQAPLRDDMLDLVRALRALPYRDETPGRVVGSPIGPAGCTLDLRTLLGDLPPQQADTSA